jgi:putative toxin-antitoxin system antitoxin component (TIGR02293 family)
MSLFMGKTKLKRSAKTPVVSEPETAYARSNHVDAAVHQILKVERGRVSDALNRVETFRKGFGKKSLENLKAVTGLDFSVLAWALSVSTKTLQRKQVFDSVQSEKMYELASLYAAGIDYFGEDGFRRWMERPLFTIGNRKPIDLIDVSEGISVLKTEIMRLQHGVSV